MQDKYSFLRSLIWVSFLTALTMWVSLAVSVVFIDFVHGNPHRTQSNAIATVFVVAPFVALFGLVCALLVFGPPQLFQAVLSNVTSRFFGRWTSAIIVIAALPVIAVITWYSFDYLLPLPDPGDGEPYQHGMTTTRYLYSLGAQLPVTLFNVAYVNTAGQRRLRVSLIMLALAAVAVGGIVMGYREAVNQYRFL